MLFPLVRRASRRALTRHCTFVNSSYVDIIYRFHYNFYLFNQSESSKGKRTRALKMQQKLILFNNTLPHTHTYKKQKRSNQEGPRTISLRS